MSQLYHLIVLDKTFQLILCEINQLLKFKKGFADWSSLTGDWLSICNNTNLMSIFQQYQSKFLNKDYWLSTGFFPIDAKKQNQETENVTLCTTLLSPMFLILIVTIRNCNWWWMIIFSPMFVAFLCTSLKPYSIDSTTSFYNLPYTDHGFSLIIPCCCLLLLQLDLIYRDLLLLSINNCWYFYAPDKCRHLDSFDGC